MDIRNAREFVHQWAMANNVRVKASGEVEGIDLSSALSTIWLDHLTAVFAFNSQVAERHIKEGLSGAPPKVKPIPKDRLEAAWDEYPRQSSKAAWQDLTISITPYTGDNEELHKWLSALIGPNIKEIDLAVMQHFLWQIKRKAQGLPVVYHLCPIFFGKQGGGKTTAIMKLLEPIKDATLQFNPDEATDSRAKATFANNLVCFFDEMANMARVEMEELKKLITADSLTYRPLYSNAFASSKQRCTFIGGSNKSMTELIYDPTGMRRFYEFNCLDTADFNVINSVNYDAVYGSIDSALERGYIEHLLPKLAEHQQARQTEDEVQQFLREMLILGGTPKDILAQDLYQAFISWRAITGFHAKTPMAVNSFGMRLASFKLPKQVKRVNGGPKTVYSINASSLAFAKGNLSTHLAGGNA